MHVLAPISIGELFDKISILEIKQRMIKDSVKLANVENELKVLKDLALTLDLKIPNILYSELVKVNQDLWDLEDKIREKEELMQFDEEFITFARGDAIYNDKRFLVKKKINEHFNSQIVEEKSYSDKCLSSHQNFEK